MSDEEAKGVIAGMFAYWKGRWASQCGPLAGDPAFCPKDIDKRINLAKRNMDALEVCLDILADIQQQEAAA